MRDGKQIRPLQMSVIPEEGSDPSLAGDDSVLPNGRLPLHQILRAPASLPDPVGYLAPLADHDAQIVRTLAA